MSEHTGGGGADVWPHERSYWSAKANGLDAGRGVAKREDVGQQNPRDNGWECSACGLYFPAPWMGPALQRCVFCLSESAKRVAWAVKHDAKPEWPDVALTEAERVARAHAAVDEAISVTEAPADEPALGMLL